MLLQRFNKNQWNKTKFIYIEYGKETKRKIREKARGKKILEEKADKRWAEKKEQLEELMEDREAETFTISATGTDVKSVTLNLLAVVSGTSASMGTSFDAKA